MKLGITLPNSWGVDTPDQAVDVGILAEDRGFDSVWVMDHLLNIGFVRERLEGRPYWHSLATLTALSVQTSKVLLGTSVLVLPYHDPVEIAKYVATLDHFSRGRVVLGVGAGGLESEFRALGIPTSQRGRLTDESIKVMRELWTSDEPSYEGARWDFTGALFSPKPYQGRRLPIWVGGSSPGAKRRAARLGDAWHPNAGSPSAFAEQAEGMRALAEQNGRDPGSLQMTFRLSVDASRHSSGWRPSVGGSESAAEVTELLNHYREVGVEHLVLALDFGDLEAITDVVEFIASEIKPHLD